MKTIFWILVLAVLAAGGYTYLSYTSMQESLPATVQDILDKNNGSHLKVTFVKVPFTAAIPFFGPTKSDGYFMVAKKEGGKLDCDLEPFNLEVREGPDSQYAIYIPGEDVQRLAHCDLQALETSN